MAAMRDHHVSPDKVRERMNAIFSKAHALNILPEVWESVQGILAEKTVSNSDYTYMSPIEMNLLPSKQRQATQATLKSLHEQIQFHLDRARRIGYVPSTIILKCTEVWEQYANNIAWELDSAHSKKQDILRLSCSVPGNPVLLIFSFFYSSKIKSIEKMIAMSKDTSLGYSNFLADILNNWPSDELTTLFNLIVCMRGKQFEYHTGFYDFQYRFKQKGEYAIFPIDLLTEFEKKSLT
jgi:hypothetical protein